jgi:hypothetical protein
MARKKSQRPATPNTGNEEIPPGATTRAADRPIHPGGAAPGSGGGPRHAAGDPGSADEEYGAVDSNYPAADGSLIDQDAPEEEPDVDAYAGPSGGAVGGTPAQGRSKGGRTSRGLRPGSVGGHGDHTVGSDPEQPTE